jgi:RNA polymerase sigma-70 factor (ECF subfamily)
MPDEAEAVGLLALMLLHDSRREARFRDGELVLLDDQDESLWNAARIEEGKETLDRALSLRRPGQYQLQAAIAALQTARPRDSAQIVALYARLQELAPTPVVALNHALAVAEADGPEQGLALLDELDLDSYHYLHAARADLLRRLARVTEARAAYARALELAHAEPERQFLERRLAEL